MSDISGPVSPPSSGRAPSSMVILLHGYGSNGADLIGLVPFWRDALPGAVFLAPNAPEPCPGAPGGRQWWGLTDLSPRALAAGVRQAATKLDAFIDKRLAEYRLTEGDTALIGFSQGTMMALHVGLRRAHALAGIVGYSGMLADAPALASEVRSKPPVLLLHGQADPMVPFAAMGEAELALKRVDVDVDTYAAPGLGHSIDETGIGRALEFLVRAFARAGPTA